MQLQIRLRLWAMTLEDRLKLALLQLRDDKTLSHAPFSGRQLGHHDRIETRNSRLGRRPAHGKSLLG